VNHNRSLTDAKTIASTAFVVDQKGGAAGDVPPNLPPPPVRITAIDGTLTNITLDAMTSKSQVSSTKRSAADYVKLFDGTGTGPDDRDGSIEGTAYLTFTLVDNSTYNIDACLNFCDSVEQCGKLITCP